jgi:hypothetical protein
MLANLPITGAILANSEPRSRIAARAIYDSQLLLPRRQAALTSHRKCTASTRAIWIDGAAAVRAEMLARPVALQYEDY